MLPFCVVSAVNGGGGYAANSKGDNYAERACRVLTKQIESLKDVFFVSCDYTDLPIPDNSVVYCDPPYRNTTQYKDNFDHDRFWNWVRVVSRSSSKVYVSEYEAPSDFKCIMEIETKTILDKNSNYKRTERLFVYDEIRARGMFSDR